MKRYLMRPHISAIDYHNRAEEKEGISEERDMILSRFETESNCNDREVERLRQTSL